jgi:hypothetical protein
VGAEIAGSQPLKGPPKQKKLATPVVGGSEAKKGPGSDFCPDIFYGVFEVPSPRTPKNVIKEIEKKSVLDFWSIFFCKTSFVVFLNPSLKKT